jgi:hypothetical protein
MLIIVRVGRTFSCEESPHSPRARQGVEQARRALSLRMQAPRPPASCTGCTLVLLICAHFSKASRQLV